MITADEAWKESMAALESIQTIDQLLDIDAKIKEYMKQPGCLGFFTPPFRFAVAEKVCIELEEMGFHARTQPSGRFTEEGDPLIVVSVSWKYLPNGASRVNATEPKNF